jgi:hypothetical protein
MRLPPCGVNRHHPNRLFTRVINAEAFSDTTIRDQSHLVGCRRGRGYSDRWDAAAFRVDPMI